MLMLQTYLYPPPLTLKHIHGFFIAGRLRKERVTATKPFERGYRFFDSKKVQGMSINMVVCGSSRIVRAAVMPSQKCGEAYTTAITVNKTNGQVLYGTCTCIAGKSACNHTAALMFAIDDANRTRESWKWTPKLYVTIQEVGSSSKI